MIELSSVAKVLADLVRIDSVNPDLVPGGAGEAAIARYVAAYLRDAGLESKVEEVAKGRWNALGILRGKGNGKSLMFNGHLDTVGVTEMAEPFSARIENGKLFGRGSEDMKGGVAAAMAAVAELAKEPRLDGDVIFTGVADEEYKSIGSRAVVEKIRADAAIVMEPTGLEVATAHKGFVWAEVETHGRAAHGSRPKEGVDAIALMGRLLVEIDQLQARLSSTSGHALLGPGSVHASLISGGQELSSYPGRCRLSIERRLIPGEDARTFEGELRHIISNLEKQDERFMASLQMGYSASALETPRESAISQTLLDAARSVIGPTAHFGVQTFWTDAAILNDAGIPSVLFGPGGAGLHSGQEYVLLSDVHQCALTLAECARRFCRAS